LISYVFDIELFSYNIMGDGICILFSKTPLTEESEG
jgi:hypothetical protein